MSQKPKRTAYTYAENSAGNTVHLARVLHAIFASKKLFNAVDKCQTWDKNCVYRIPVVGENFHKEANQPFEGSSFPNDKKSYQGKDFIALRRKPMKIILEACLSGKKSHVKEAIATLQNFLDAKSSSKKQAKYDETTPSPKKEKIVDTLPDTVDELTLSNE